LIETINNVVIARYGGAGTWEAEAEGGGGGGVYTLQEVSIQSFLLTMKKTT